MKKYVLSQLGKLSSTEREAAMSDLLKGTSARPNGELEETRQRVKAFELEFSMSSKELHEGLASGKLRETTRIASWLFETQLLSDLERR